ncbi:MAG: hypothetical protein AAFO06_10650 [Cyanobacteria bacterium J06597_16]
MQSTTATLDQILDSAAKLPSEQQQMLIEILKSRYVESRRAQIVEDAKQAEADFEAGLLKPLSADEAIAELRDFLNEPKE